MDERSFGGFGVSSFDLQWPQFPPDPKTMIPSRLGEIQAIASNNQFTVNKYKESGSVMCLRASVAFIRGFSMYGVKNMLNTGVLDLVLRQGMSVTEEFSKGAFPQMIDCEELPGLWSGTKPEEDLFIVSSVAYGYMGMAAENIEIHPKPPQVMSLDEFSSYLFRRKQGKWGLIVILDAKAIALVVEENSMYVFDSHGWQGSPAYVVKIAREPKALTKFIREYLLDTPNARITYTFVYVVPAGAWPPDNSIDTSSLEMVNFMNAFVNEIFDTTDASATRTSFLKTQPLPPFSSNYQPDETMETMSSRWNRIYGRANRSLRGKNKRASERPSDPAFLGSSEKINLSARKQRKARLENGSGGPTLSVYTGLPELKELITEVIPSVVKGKEKDYHSTDVTQSNQVDPPSVHTIMRSAPNVWASFDIREDDLASHTEDLKSAVGNLKKQIDGVSKYRQLIPYIRSRRESGDEFYLLREKMSRLAERLLAFSIENGILLNFEPPSMFEQILKELPILVLERDRLAASLAKDTRLNFKALVDRREDLFRLLNEGGVSPLLPAKVSLVAGKVGRSTTDLLKKLETKNQKAENMPCDRVLDDISKELTVFASANKLVLEKTSDGVDLIAKIKSIVSDVKQLEMRNEILQSSLESVVEQALNSAIRVTNNIGKHVPLDIPKKASEINPQTLGALQNTLSEKYKVLQENLETTIKNAFVEYAEVIEYSLALHSPSQGNVFGSFSLPNERLANIRSWLINLALTDSQLSELYNVVFENNSPYRSLLDNTHIYTLRTVLESSDSLNTQEEIFNWSRTLSQAHEENYLPPPKKWIAAVLEINAKFAARQAAGYTLDGLKNDLEIIRNMNASYQVKLEAVKNVQSAIKQAASKASAEHSPYVTELENSATTMIRELTTAMKHDESSTKSQIKALKSLLKPLEKFQGLRLLLKNMNIFGLTPNSVIKYGTENPESGAELYKDAYFLLSKYQETFSSLEDINDLSGLGSSMLIALSMAAGINKEQLDRTVEEFFSKYADNLITTIEHALQEDSPKAVSGAQEAIESVIDDLGGSVTQFTQFLHVAADLLRSIETGLASDIRANEIRSRLTKIVNDVNATEFLIEDGEMTVTDARKEVARIKNAIQDIAMLNIELESENKLIEKLDSKLKNISVRLKKKINEDSKLVEELELRFWLSALKKALEVDLDKAEFDLGNWNSLSLSGDQYGGRSAIPDSLTSMAATVIDTYSKRGTDLLVAFFKVNPYSPTPMVAGAVGNHSVAAIVADVAWRKSFLNVAQIYVDLFGARVESLLRICRIMEEVAIGSEVTVDGSFVDTYTIVARTTADMLVVPELKQFVDFYGKDFEAYRGRLEHMKIIRQKAGMLEQESHLEFEEMINSASIVRGPETARKRLEEGENSVAGLQGLEDLKNELSAIDAKGLSGSAYHDAVSQDILETKKSIDQTLNLLEKKQSETHKKVQTILKAVVQIEEDEKQEKERGLKRLKNMLIMDVPRSVGTALEKAASLDDIITIFLNLLREEEKSSVVDMDTVKWMINAAMLIDSSEIAKSIDDQGPLREYHDVLNALRQKRERAQIFMEKLNAMVETCNNYVKEFQNAKSKNVSSKEGFHYFTATFERAEQSVKELFSILESDDAKLISPETIRAYSSKASVYANIINENKTDIKSISEALMTYDDLYGKVPTAVTYNTLLELEREINTNPHGQHLPTWYRNDHRGHRRLITLRLSLYRSYETLGVSDLGNLHVDVNELEKSSKYLSQEYKTRIRVTASMVLDRKRVSTVSTHKALLDKVILTYHIDDDKRPLEYTLCFPTAVQKASAVWTSLEDSRTAVQNLWPNIPLSQEDSGALDKIASIEKSAAAVNAIADWFIANMPLVDSEVSSYSLFCLNKVWPARPGDAASSPVSQSASFAAIVYATVMSIHGNVKDFGIDSNGEKIESPEKLKLETGQPTSKVRTVRFSASELLLIIMVCEPLYAMVFGRLSLLKQTEFINKTLEKVLLRITKERIGVSTLDLGTMKSNDRTFRKPLNFKMTPERFKLDPSKATGFTIFKEDWKQISLPTTVERIIDLWKGLFGEKVPKAIEDFDRVNGKGLGVASTIALLCKLSLSKKAVDILWDALRPDSSTNTSEERDVMNFLKKRASPTHRFFSSPVGVPTDPFAEDQTGRKELMEKALCAVTFTLTEDVNKSMSQLTAFDIAVFSLAFGARIVMAYESSYEFNQAKGLSLLSTVFDSRNLYVREGIISNSMFARDNLDEVVKQLLLIDNNPIENSCLKSQLKELSSLLTSKFLKDFPPLLILLGKERLPKRVLVPSDGSPLPFVVSMSEDDMYKEVPLRKGDRSLFPYPVSLDEGFISKVLKTEDFRLTPDVKYIFPNMPSYTDTVEETEKPIADPVSPSSTIAKSSSQLSDTETNIDDARPMLDVQHASKSSHNIKKHKQKHHKFNIFKKKSPSRYANVSLTTTHDISDDDEPVKPVQKSPSKSSVLINRRLGSNIFKRLFNKKPKTRTDEDPEKSLEVTPESYTEGDDANKLPIENEPAFQRNDKESERSNDSTTELPNPVSPVDCNESDTSIHSLVSRHSESEGLQWDPSYDEFQPPIHEDVESPLYTPTNVREEGDISNIFSFDDYPNFVCNLYNEENSYLQESSEDDDKTVGNYGSVVNVNDVSVQEINELDEPYENAKNNANFEQNIDYSELSWMNERVSDEDVFLSNHQPVQYDFTDYNYFLDMYDDEANARGSKPSSTQPSQQLNSDTNSNSSLLFRDQSIDDPIIYHERVVSEPNNADEFIDYGQEDMIALMAREIINNVEENHEILNVNEKPVIFKSYPTSIETKYDSDDEKIAKIARETLIGLDDSSEYNKDVEKDRETKPLVFNIGLDQMVSVKGKSGKNNVSESKSESYFPKYSEMNDIRTDLKTIPMSDEIYEYNKESKQSIKDRLIKESESIARFLESNRNIIESSSISLSVSEGENDYDEISVSGSSDDETGGVREFLPPLSNKIKRDIYGRLSVACRVVSKGIERAIKESYENANELQRETIKIKMLLR